MKKQLIIAFAICVLFLSACDSAKVPPATRASAAAEALPSATCTAGLTRLDLRIGGGIPWPSIFSNTTSSTVRFTVRLAKSWFFGPARDIGTVTLPPHTGRISSSVVLTFLHTPLGVGTVVIEVRTDRTGAKIIGRCDYQLHLLAPLSVEVGTVLRPEKRWLYQVPVRLCAVEGSELAGVAKPGQTVLPGQLLKTLEDVNAKIWYPQAQIAFSTATDYAIPVIADPSPPSVDHARLGDLEVGGPSIEAAEARDLCRQAWQDRFPGRVGIPIVNARTFVFSGDTLGVSPGPAAGLYVHSRRSGSGLRGDDLCGSPVRLTPDDVSASMVVMVDQSRLTLVGVDGLTTAVRELAHELGHNLFLGHGNGFDDDGNGRPAGIRGPKRYDEYCDPAWLIPPQNLDNVEDQATPFVNCATSSSLMNRFASCTELRPLQVETARGVALVIPGTVNGTESPVVGFASPISRSRHLRRFGTPPPSREPHIMPIRMRH